MKKIDKIVFINKCTEIHNKKYNYSITNYINMRLKIKVICPYHGEFEQKAQSHILGQGCPICATEYKNKKKSLSKKDFIKKAKNIHGDKYDYTLVKYKNSKTKIRIICPYHGEFSQESNSHLLGNGCPSCGGVKKLNTLLFIKKAKNIHGDKYDYSLVKYKNIRTKVNIICKTHGMFDQIPSGHLDGKGCHICNDSKGERKIRTLLENNNIKYIFQKRFKDCKNINPLPFDFYLPDYNLCIEYDGIQHYKSINIWGGEKEFKLRQKRDQLKNEYCEKNNIRLIRIRYNENISDKINFI